MTEQERFEAWFSTHPDFYNYHPTHDESTFKWDEENNTYYYDYVRVRWEAWQAAIPKGFVLMPEKLSIEQVNGLYYSGHAWGDIDETKEYFEDVYDTLISSRGI